MLNICPKCGGQDKDINSHDISLTVCWRPRLRSKGKKIGKKTVLFISEHVCRKS